MGKRCPSCNREFVGLERFCSPRCEAMDTLRTVTKVEDKVTPVTEDVTKEVDDGNKVTEDNVTPDGGLPVTKRRGRPRIYKDAAEKQRAYRKRKRAKK